MENHSLKWMLIAAAMNVASFVQAQYPIIQTNYTADPAPVVVNDTVFLYTSHDEDDADWFKMLDWRLYTSVDMVNWTDHGSVASLKNFAWNPLDNGAWAAQVIERNDKFYMYCPIHCVGIGVLVSDSPYGPFIDPIGKPLIHQKDKAANEDIDPTVMIDDDGQAYMYWGHSHLYCVKLNEDMISYSGEIIELDTPQHFQEGPWIFKRDNKYYVAFASTCCPEGIGYAMSDSPLGPWKTAGYIMAPTERTRGNHPGVLNYKGKDYIFGFSYDVLRMETNEHHERRNVEAAEMTFNADGTIKEVPYWRETSLTQIKPLKPYETVEAETMAWGYGLKTAKIGERNMCVNNISDGKYICVRGVDFGNKGAKKFLANIAPGKNGGKIEIRIDAADGKCIGSLDFAPETTPSDIYRQFTCKVDKTKGLHDLYLCFKGDGENLFSIDNWTFKK